MRTSRLPEPFVHKLLIILACVPITPIVVGTAALYRRYFMRRKPEPILDPQIVPAAE